MTLTKISTFLILLLFSCSIFGDESFPGRDKYPDIPYISLNDFYMGYINNQYAVVDARSNFEFHVIHIKGAVNISVNADDFFSKINDFSQQTSKTIVFYCNGRRCMKSFKAAEKSKLLNVLVFDAGVFEWSVAHPELSVLLDKSPMDPDDIISKNKLKEHIVPLKKFESMIKDSVLIDIRHFKERRGTGLFLLADKSVPLDNKKKLERYINKALINNKTLLAYDNSGKEIRWLQYYLEEKGMTDYYFMQGGAKYYTYDQ